MRSLLMCETASGLFIVVVVFVVFFAGEAIVGSEEPAVGRAASVVIKPVGPVGI